MKPILFSNSYRNWTLSICGTKKWYSYAHYMLYSINNYRQELLQCTIIIKPFWEKKNWKSPTEELNPSKTQFVKQKSHFSIIYSAYAVAKWIRSELKLENKATANIPRKFKHIHKDHTGSFVNMKCMFLFEKIGLLCMFFFTSKENIWIGTDKNDFFMVYLWFNLMYKNCSEFKSFVKNAFTTPGHH